jgi:hypothetical protein
VEKFARKYDAQGKKLAKLILQGGNFSDKVTEKTDSG